jgi:hypothetical protein
MHLSFAATWEGFMLRQLADVSIGEVESNISAMERHKFEY